MKYAELAAVYLSAPPVAVPVVSSSPARRLRDALEPIATQGWWAADVHPPLDAAGLGFLESYVWGRAAALGDPPAAGVVVATFGVFEPTFLAGVFEASRTMVSRADVLAAREAGAVASLARVTEATAGVVAAGDALLAAAAAVDATARPLFAALRGLPAPASPLGRLWRGAELVREHRGDGHLAACVAHGLDPVEMNVLTERWLGYGLGEYSGTRGYGPDVIGAAVARLQARGLMVGDDLSADGGRERDAIEDATDRSQDALVAALGDALEAVIATAEPISAALVAAASFPPDGRKRAAG